jgi:sigma-B regulation protein RsbU (phosphoserine phosphatase)
MALMSAPVSETPATWQERLAHIVETMREMSTHTDPQQMVQSYGNRMRRLVPDNTFIAISRRDLPAQQYRITRTTKWNNTINPWKERDKLPVFEGGLLGKLLYDGKPQLLPHLEISRDDPAFDFLEGQQSLIAIPHFDQGEAINMVIILRKEKDGFDPNEFPEQVWISNLFGRATHNLVLREQVQDAFDAVDRELKAVAAIQRSLLPKKLPNIPGLDLAAFYHTSARAGGDYYDIYPLPGNLWGILIADVSGHGTPAAVLMAVTHSIVHSYPGPAAPPGEMLQYVNQRLSAAYTSDVEAFVTAFYGVYDPATKKLTYANAGHPPPRLKRCSTGTLHTVDGERSLPLGIFDGTTYPQQSVELIQGDQLLFYTDGITEAHNHAGEMYGTARLDGVLSNCGITAQGLLDEVISNLDAFTQGRHAEDDRTLVVMKVR